MPKRYGYTTVYSLADYVATITFPGFTVGETTFAPETFQIGGAGENNEGSCVGEIRVTRANDMWTTEDDPTGSWVHSKNLGKRGTIQFSIKQVSDYIIKFMLLSNQYEKLTGSIRRTDGLRSGLQIELAPENGGSSEFISCDDCFPVKVPDQIYAGTAQDQELVFTSGRVSYNPIIND